MDCSILTDLIRIFITNLTERLNQRYEQINQIWCINSNEVYRVFEITKETARGS